MRPLPLALALALWPASALAQQAPGGEARPALFVELGGPAVVYAIHVERLDGRAALRVGASYYTLSGEQTLPGGQRRSRSGRYALLPVGGSYLLFGGDHHLELGASLSFVYADSGGDPAGSPAPESGLFVTPSLLAGYRYQHPGGFLLRAGFTPLVINGSFTPWGALGVGAVF